MTATTKTPARSFHEQNNDRQLHFLREALGEYHQMLETVDSQVRLYEKERSLGKVDRLIEDLSLDDASPDLRKAVEALKKVHHSEQRTVARIRQQPEHTPTIEVILNQYKGTNLILPIKKTDLHSSPESLFNKLYLYCQEVWDDPDITEHLFEGYVRLSLPRLTDKFDLAQKITQQATKEFSGERLYLRVATNFSIHERDLENGKEKKKESERAAATNNAPAANQVEIQLKEYTLNYGLIRFSKPDRLFFPPFQVPFLLDTPSGSIETYVTSASDARVGDADKGAYITTGIKDAYRNMHLKVGDVIVVEKLAEKHYRLSKR